MSTVNTSEVNETATTANMEAVRAFMANNPTVAKRSPPQGVMTLSQVFRFISLSPGRYGVLWEYARDYGLTLTDSTGKAIWGCENPQEPDERRRRVFRRLVANKADIQTALNELYWQDHQGLRDGVEVEEAQVWVRVNSAGMFGGRLVEDLDEAGKPTGRAARSSGPNHALSSLATAAEAVAWRRMLGIPEHAVSELLGKQRLDTFVGPFRAALTGEIRVVVDQDKVTQSESDFRLVRGIGERRQPTTLPDRFATTATRAAAMRGAGGVKATTTTTATTVDAPAPSVGAQIFAAFEGGKCSIDQLQRYMELSRAAKAAEEGLRNLLAEVRGE